MRKLTLLVTVTLLSAPAVLNAAPDNLRCEIANPTFAQDMAQYTSDVNAWNAAYAAAQKADKTITSLALWTNAPPFPTPPKMPTDCFRDDVLILSGEPTMVGGKKVNLIDCQTLFPEDATAMKKDPDPTPNPVNCKFDYTTASQVVAEWLKAKGVNTQYDQLVMFAVQSKLATNPPGPLFYREGYSEDATGVPLTDGYNTVGGIGLKVAPKPMPAPGAAPRPWVGYIWAGSTDLVPGNPSTGAYGPCGKARTRTTDDLQAQPAKAICYPDGTAQSYFDALAQATGAQFGPYLSVDTTKSAAPASLSVPPAQKSGLGSMFSVTSGKFGTTLDPALQPRIWNSFLNTKGSVFSGNTYRDNGNGTYETTNATPYYGVSAPFAGANGNGRQVLRFMPLDLYLMGFLPLGDTVDPALGVDGAIMQSFMMAKPESVYRPLTTAWRPDLGPWMGLRPAVAIRPPNGKVDYITINDIAMNGPRNPPFECPPNDAKCTPSPHFIKQLWVVFTKPKDFANLNASLLDPMAKSMMPKPGTDPAAGMTQDPKLDPTIPRDPRSLNGQFVDTPGSGASSMWTQIGNATVWRRQFGAYFYMLTGYRGHVVTTVEGNVDDTTYYEFGQPVDDTKTFKKVGDLDMTIPGWEDMPIPPDRKQVVRITRSGGDGSGLQFNPQPLPLRISGDQRLRAPYNSIVVRMRISPNTQIAKGSYAKLTLTGGPNGPVEYRIPTNCGNPARPGCKEETSLIADGKWRNYSASLVSDWKTDQAFTGGTDDPTVTVTLSDPNDMNSRKLVMANSAMVDPKAVPTFTGFTFVPSVQPFAVNNPVNPDDGMEIEYIKIASVPSAADTDAWCVPCNECVKKWSTDGKGTVLAGGKPTTCAQLCFGKGDLDKVFIDRPDGWIDSEDNCKNTYNPDQADGNNDGVGDACEDYDGDGVINACDNCPTTTNSRQKDDNQNGVGDVCEGSGSSSCFLSAQSLAGPVRKPSGAVLVSLLGAGVGVLLVRRRRRRT